MAITVYNLRKWYKMLTGKNILHVNQGMGQCFSPGRVNGYFNDLTEKVLKEPELLHTKKLPVVKAESGENITFPVAIFQYGLGAYDLFLQTGRNEYLDKFNQCVKWAMENQLENGAWNNFFFMFPKQPYGAMCQGESVSLLLRAFENTGDTIYFNAAKRAIDFMLTAVENGDTAKYMGDDLVLLECTHKPAVLNGWIFALFGLYDFTLVSDDKEYYTLLERTLKTLKKTLPRFDCGYWSMYDDGGMIASPFYHSLHIAQMEALYKITGNALFEQYRQRWLKDRSSKLKKARAFLKKAYQKTVEKSA